MRKRAVLGLVLVAALVAAVFVSAVPSTNTGLMRAIPGCPSCNGLLLGMLSMTDGSGPLAAGAITAVHDAYATTAGQKSHADVMISNAGVMSPGVRVTGDGTRTYLEQPGSGVVAVQPMVRQGADPAGWFTFTWSNADIVAFGASATTGNLKICTVPAGYAVHYGAVKIGTAGAGVTTLTVSLGRTGTAYVDFLAASDAKATAATVYQGAWASAVTPIDPIITTTSTDIYAQFICTGSGKHLSDVTTSTGTVALYISRVW